MTWTTFDANRGIEVIVMLDLLEEVLDTDDQKLTTSGIRAQSEEIHACDGCRVARPDVDLWATDTETGDEVWFCLPCGEW